MCSVSGCASFADSISNLQQKLHQRPLEMRAYTIISTRRKTAFSPSSVIDRRKELVEASIIEDYVALPDTEKLGSAVEAHGSIKLTSDDRHPAGIHGGRFATRNNHAVLSSDR